MKVKSINKFKASGIITEGYIVLEMYYMTVYEILTSYKQQKVNNHLQTIYKFVLRIRTFTS